MNPFVASQGAGTCRKVRPVTLNIGGTTEFPLQGESFRAKILEDLEALMDMRVLKSLSHFVRIEMWISHAHQTTLIAVVSKILSLEVVGVEREQ